MRRSFGPGMGSGGGGRGGGTIKTVHRAVRAGLGGGASQEPYSHSATTTTRTTTNRNQPTNATLSISSNANASSSSSYYTHPLPAPSNWAFPSSPTAGEEFEWEYIHGGGSDVDDGESTLNRVLYDDFVFGSVPSKDEVHHAVSSLHEVLDPIIDDGIGSNSGSPGFHKPGSELDWIEPSMQLRDSISTLHDPRFTSVYDAFHLLQIEPSIQRMVISLSSDKAVWDAVMNNEVVRELRESISEGKSISEFSEDSVDDDDDDDDDDDNDSNAVTQVLRWIYVNTKEKAIEIVEKITKMVNELVGFMGEDEKSKKDTDVGSCSFDDKVRSSFLLSIMVLLIVVVSRSRKC